MVETIIGSLILMFVSSLGFIAYKHPYYFMEKLYLPLFFLSSAVFLCIFAWNSALEKSIKELTIFIQKDKLVIAEKLLLGKFEVDWTITLLSYLFLIVYLTILLIVSTGLKDRK